MHRNNFWTDKWMQEPRNIFLQEQLWNPRQSNQYEKNWGIRMVRKRGLNLCYDCRRPGHIAKEFHEVGPIFLCCKLFGYQVEDCLRIISL